MQSVEHGLAIGARLVQVATRAQIDLPVLMLTARDAIADRVQGLDAGADDYAAYL